MMTLSDVWANIALSKEAFRNIIITSNERKLSDNEIGWDNYTSGIFKNFYAKEYEVITRNRQYSFLLAEDKGCIQFYYQFKEGELNKAKLAYYPYPVELRDQATDFENYLSDSDDAMIQEYYYDIWNILTHQFELTVSDEDLQNMLKESKAVGNDETPANLILGSFERKYKFTNSSHIRIDYDAGVTTHHKCEIQIGAVNNLRFPMEKLISPFIFFDFIAKNLFKEKYKVISSHANYKTNFNVSKKTSAFIVKPFTEDNIFTSHT